MSWKTKQTEELFQAILALKSQKEAEQFFRDLLTEEEIIDFSKRFQVAQMLFEQIPYAEIQKTTKLSTRTIARISKWLGGKNGGYRLVLDRLHPHTTPRLTKKASA